MTRHAPELDLLAAARPQACAHTDVLVSDDERRALLAAITADQHQQRAARPRPRRRLVTMTVAASAAALAVGAALLASPRSGTAPGVSQGIRTTAYVVAATETALADASHDVLEMHVTTRAGRDSTVWLEVPTGAFRSDTYVHGALATASYVEHGTAVIVYYPGRQWWSFAHTRGLASLGTQVTPRYIRAQLKARRYRLVGEATVDDQRCLELRAVLGPIGERSAPVAIGRTVDLWVNARSYLPVLETMTGPLLIRNQVSFTWEPVTPASTVVFEVHIPAGFKHMRGP
jgi:hypothetical protein